MKINWPATIIKFTFGLPVLLVLSILKTWAGLVWFVILMDESTLENAAEIWKPTYKRIIKTSVAP